MIKPNQKKEQKRKRGLVFCLLAVSLFLRVLTAQADEIRYIYDEKGQLIGVVNQQGQTAIYEYDALGNLLAIQRQDATNPVEITFVNPDIGPVGTQVEIFGIGFSPVAAENQIEFNGVSAPILAVSTNSITTQVPNGSSTGPITVTTPLGSAASPQPFSVPNMAVSPSDTAAIVRKNVPFIATFTDLDDQRTIWKVNDVVGGNVALGTITQEGLYTAPATIPMPSTVVVLATSVRFPSLTDQATVTIVKDPTLPDCTIFWDGESGDGLWQTPANWDTNTLPSPVDDACIGVGSTVTLSAGDHNTNSLTSDGAFIISGGSFSISSGSHFFNDFTLSGGTLTGTGNVTVFGLFTWTSGTMSGTGTTTANGGMDLSSLSTKVLARQLTLPVGQEASWVGGLLNFFGMATFNNMGIFRVEHTGDGFIQDVGGTGTKTFNNAGSFIKETETGVTSILNEIVFNNTGEVQVLAGTLGFYQGSTGQFLIVGGDFMVSAGATLDFRVNSTWGSTANITGAGTVLFVSGTHTINGTYNINSTTGHTIFQGGTVDFSSGELSNLTTYTQSGGTVTGSGDIAVSGLLTWTSGTMSGTGTTTANGGMDLSSLSTKVLARQLTLPAGQEASWTGGLLNFFGMATFNNMGTFRVEHTDNGFIQDVGGTGTKTFNNAGSFIKETGTGITTIGNGIVFNNTGEVQVLAGTLGFQTTFTQTSGSILLNGGALSSTLLLDIQGGSLLGIGTITGNVSIAGSVGPGLTPGTLNISGTYTQTSTGSLDNELGGLVPGSGHDQINITGAAALSGDLNVALIGGFTPVVGDSFVIMTYGSVTGNFSNTNLPSGFNWNVSIGSTSVTLTVVP